MDLIIAVRQGHLGRVREILDKGADVETRGPHGHTLLILALLHQRFDLVQELCERGANVDETDTRGWTTLKRAVETLDIMQNDWVLPPLRLQYTRILKLVCRKGARVFDAGSSVPSIQTLLIKQQFRHNVLVLVDESILSIDLLRCVHQFM